MSGNLEKVGWVLILNNEKFDNNYENKRTGSQCDVKKLINVFNLLDFRMNVVKDPTLQDIKNIMNQLLVEDLSNVLCLVIVVMSHGAENGKIAARDQWYNIETEILCSKVFENDKLPKIVITQACKTPSGSQKEEDKRQKTTCKNNRVNKNTLCFDSTFEGLPATRFENGSPFIDILCTNLSKSGHILKILEITNNTTKEFHDKYSLRQIPFKNAVHFNDLCVGARILSVPPVETEQ